MIFWRSGRKSVASEHHYPNQERSPKNLTLWYFIASVLSRLAASARAMSLSRAFRRRSVATRTSAASLSWILRNDDQAESNERALLEPLRVICGSVVVNSLFFERQEGQRMVSSHGASLLIFSTTFEIGWTWLSWVPHDLTKMLFQIQISFEYLSLSCCSLGILYPLLYCTLPLTLSKTRRKQRFIERLSILSWRKWNKRLKPLMQRPQLRLDIRIHLIKTDWWSRHSCCYRQQRKLHLGFLQHLYEMLEGTCLDSEFLYSK